MLFMSESIEKFILKRCVAAVSSSRAICMQVELINPIKMIAKSPEPYRNTFNKDIFNKKRNEIYSSIGFKWKVNLFQTTEEKNLHFD